MGIVEELETAVEIKGEGDYDGALERFTVLAKSRPVDFITPGLWARLFNAPDWFQSQEEAKRYLRYAENLLSQVEALACYNGGKAAIEAVKSFIQETHFRLTTHNQENLAPLMSRRASVFKLALSDFSSLVNYTFPSKVSAGGKIRYGIILKHLRQDPETTTALSYFQFAKAHDFHVILFVVSKYELDDFSAEITRAVNEIHLLPSGLADSVHFLRAMDLDFLFFANDVSAKASLPALLTFFRVARRAFTCVSTIATTRSPMVDFYIGGRYFFERNHHVEFSEDFLPIGFPGFAFSLPVKREVDERNYTRVALELPPDAVLMSSGANFTKLHNELLEKWGNILLRCPNTYLVLYPFPPHFGPERFAYVERWLKIFVELGVDKNRIRILRSLGSREAVIALLKTVDVALDSFPYSGLTTVVDACEAGVPIVVPTGPVLRNNHGAAILDSIGLRELISGSADEYERIAVDLLTSGQLRRSIAEKLRLSMSTRPSFLRPELYCEAVVSTLRGIHKDINA